MLIPQTFVAVVAFFLLIAPGAFFEIQRQRRRPSKSESALRELSGIVLASVIFSGLAVAVLAILQGLWPANWPALLPDVGRWLREGSKYAAGNLGLIGRAALAEFLIALSIVYLFSKWLERRERGSFSSNSVWRIILHEEVPSHNDAYARVELEGGSVYGGVVSDFGASKKKDERDLALGPPKLMYKPSAYGKLDDLEAKGYTRVVIPGASIRSIWVSYRLKQAETPVEAPKGPASQTPRETTAPSPPNRAGTSAEPTGETPAQRSAGT